MLKTLFILEKTDKKNIFSILLVAIFVIGMVVFVNAEDLGNSTKEKSGEYQTVKMALNKFQKEDASEDGDGSDLYKNIVKQYHSVSKQVMALKTDRPQLYFDAAIDLTELRRQAFEMEDYERVANNLPTKIENELDYAYYQYLKKNELDLSLNTFNFFQFFAFLFSVVGAIWFVFISLYSSNSMIEDFRHTSLIKGYPISFGQYVLAKCMTSMGIVIIFIIELVVCSLPLIYFKGLGDAAYPVSVFTGEVTIYTIAQYVTVSVLYMIFIAIFTILLSIILNVLLKNVYLTLFVQLLLFIFPTLFPSLVKLMPYNPFNYLNFTSVLRGDALNLENPVALSSGDGLLTLGISIVLLMVMVNRFLTSGRLKNL